MSSSIRYDIEFDKQKIDTISIFDTLVPGVVKRGVWCSTSGVRCVRVVDTEQESGSIIGFDIEFDTKSGSISINEKLMRFDIGYHVC